MEERVHEWHLSKVSLPDRRVANAVAIASYNGGNYSAAQREADVDDRAYLYRPRGKDEVLPWEHIDVGVSKAYLWSEYQKALKGETTGACRVGSCKACGACV